MGAWGAARPEPAGAPLTCGSGAFFAPAASHPSEPQSRQPTPPPNTDTHARARARDGCSRGGGHTIKRCARSLWLLTGAQRLPLFGLGRSRWLREAERSARTLVDASTWWFQVHSEQASASTPESLHPGGLRSPAFLLECFRAPTQESGCSDPWLPQCSPGGSVSLSTPLLPSLFPFLPISPTFPPSS